MSTIRYNINRGGKKADILLRSIRRILIVTIILWGVLVLTPLHISCQIPPYHESWRWVHFSTEDGLPSNRVIDLVDIEYGKTWVKTSNGISFYDGYSWTNIDSSYGLPRGPNEMFFVDPKGIVVVTYSDGRCFRGNQYGFKELIMEYKNVRIPPFDIVKYSERQYLVLHQDRKLYLWDTAFSQCIPYPFFKPEEKSARLWTTQSGNIWIENRYDLYCIENGKPVVKIHSPYDPLNVQQIVEDSSHGGFALLVYPPRYNGIWKWSPRSQPALTEEGKRFEVLTLSTHPTSYPMYAYAYGEIRLFVNERWQPIIPLPQEMRNILFFRYKENGDLWVATESGLNLFRASYILWTYLQRNEKRSNIVSELLLTKGGSLWIGTDSGICIRSSAGKTQFFDEILGQKLIAITGLAEDYQKNIWASSGSSFQGAYCWDGKTWNYFGAPQGLPSLIHRIMKDRQGRLWFLGISRYIDSDTYEPGAFLYTNGHFTPWGTKEGLGNGRVYAFAEGTDSSYWFGTSGGISCWKNGAWQYWNTSNGLVSDRVFSLAIDSNNTVWFSHQYSGLGYFRNGKPHYVTTVQGSVNDAVWDIKVDSLNRVWATTTNGLLYYNQETWSRFGENIGLGQVRLWPIVPTKNKIYVGSIGGGVAILNLDYLDPFPPKVMLSRPIIEKNSSWMRWHPFSFWGELPSHLIETRYKLDDGLWSEWSTDREKVFLNMPSGTHIFTVQANGMLGNYAPMGYSVPITIEPPYYLQPHFLFPVILLSGGMILFGFLSYVRKRKHSIELKLSEERYRGIVRDQTDLICRFTPDGVLHFVNEAYRRYYNISSESLVGKHFVEQLSKRNQREFAEHVGVIKTLTVDKPTSAFIQESIFENGDVRWLEWIDRAFFDGAGNLIEIQSVGRDITEQKRINEALRQSEKDYRGLFENAHDGIMIFSPDDEVILEANQRACEIYGFDRDEFIGMSIATISHNVLQGKERIQETIKKGFQYQFETIQYRKDGSKMFLDINASVIDYHRQLAILSINRDITERKKTELAIIHREAILEALSFAGQQFMEPGSLEEKIQNIITRLGVAANVSRIYLFENSLDTAGKLVTSQRYEWVVPGIPPQITNPQLQNLSYEDSGFSRWADFLRNGLPIEGNIADFPESEQTVLNVQGIRSIIVMPIMVNNTWWGFIGFDECTQARNWSSAEIDVLSTAATMLGSALERQQREKTVHMLAQAIKSISECVSITDSENNLIFVNEAFCKTYGYDESELIGKSISIVACEDVSTPVSLILPATIRGGWQGELINRKKDGTMFPIYLSTSPVKDDQQYPIALIGVAKDIAEEKLIEQQLREKVSLLTITTDAIIVEYMNHDIKYWNPGAERLYGWQADEVMGKHAHDILHEGDAQRSNQIWSILLSRGEWRGELKQHSKAGKEIFVDSRYTVVLDELSQPVSILIVNTDITEKKILEEQILRSQRLESIGTLAGGIAHDLNNVLAPILLAIEVLKNRVTDNSSLAILDTLETSAIRGKDIIKQVLTFARGVRGERTALQPGNLLKEMEHIIRETFPKSVHLAMNIPSDLWTIVGDRTQLHQVLLNMCLNARDAMQSGGRLTLSAENKVLDEDFVRIHLDAKPGTYVSLSINDTGMGIHPDLVDKIFDPFFTTKEVGKGTGLGLSTAHAIVKGHNGFITVSSTRDGGSTFVVFLPASQSAEIEERIKAPQQISQGKGELILVVDDEEAIREIAYKTLESAGYTVITAIDGTDAVATYIQQQKNVALVVTDILMPYMDGVSLIRSLRQINPSVKIIAASGQQTDMQFLIAGGVKTDAFLSKPFTAETFLATIYSVLYDYH